MIQNSQLKRKLSFLFNCFAKPSTACASGTNQPIFMGFPVKCGIKDYRKLKIFIILCDFRLLKFDCMAYVVESVDTQAYTQHMQNQTQKFYCTISSWQWRQSALFWKLCGRKLACKHKFQCVDNYAHVCNGHIGTTRKSH